MPRSPKTKKARPASYDPEAAGEFWSRRLKAADPIAAVLTFDAPPALNRAYDQWERSLLRSLLPKKLHGRPALDVGCGIGRIAVELAQAGAEVTAVDVSSAMLTACRQRARRAGVASRLTTVLGSADRLPVGGRFDVITCFGLLEHLPSKERGACLREAFARLAAHGRMFVVVNNHQNIFLAEQYPLTRQRADGYFVGLVGLPWLRRFCSRHGLSITICGANPFYALTHYHLLPHRRRLKLTGAEIDRICALAGALDLAHPLDGPLPDRIASHFLVEIRRTRKRD